MTTSLSEASCCLRVICRWEMWVEDHKCKVILAYLEIEASYMRLPQKIVFSSQDTMKKKTTAQYPVTLL